MPPFAASGFAARPKGVRNEMNPPNGTLAEVIPAESGGCVSPAPSYAADKPVARCRWVDASNRAMRRCFCGRLYAKPEAMQTRCSDRRIGARPGDGQGTCTARRTLAPLRSPLCARESILG